MPIRIFILTTFFIASSCIAQNNQIKTNNKFGSISGSALEKYINRPITELMLIIEPLNHYVFTDSLGKFIFNDLPPCIYSISSTSICYEKIFIDSVILNGLENVDITLFLKEHCTNKYGIPISQILNRVPINKNDKYIYVDYNNYKHKSVYVYLINTTNELIWIGSSELDDLRPQCKNDDEEWTDKPESGLLYWCNTSMIKYYILEPNTYLVFDRPIDKFFEQKEISFILPHHGFLRSNSKVLK